ncbi:hypothetical protein [Brevibacterium oceani]|uniref:hypothetical protein n=1 Tax=Brevibacterium oceani TaxID=358099 RepID=UPI001B339981|nr:hypothetical protein [Brevibacterium oceani]
MKRFALGLIAATCALALTGCGDDSGNQADNGGRKSEESANPADAEAKEASERAALSPDDYSARVLSLDDIPEGFTLDDSTEFGEKEEQSTNPFDSEGSSSDDATTQTECIIGAIGTHSSDLDGVSTARSYEQSGDSNAAYIMTSLSRTEKESDTILKDLRKTVDGCADDFTARPTESSDMFEPSGYKGVGFCATAYDGTFTGQGKMVMSSCYVSWAGELLTVHYMAVEAGTSLVVEEDAIDGVTGYMTDDFLPKALEKADMAAS